MMSDELGGSSMISLMPWAKISSLGMIFMVIVGGFGAELAEFGEGKLPILYLGTNMGSFLIFLCIDLG
ncbi:hypothetical protein TIFTF001_029855 [Ficus carica]|uniref:Uncharacterized protein n=1 Tax=Ficus carica TaxID=3494 RepID=A0AA88J2Y4_FICCA|nr:hypothetical protein TIFTF001_029855 [Ficus carica]